MGNILTFEEAVKDSSRLKKRHLLLGNGFSIACRPNIFTYDSLFEQANFSETPQLKKVFRALESIDFEHVIRILEDTSRIASIYFSDAEEAINHITQDAVKLKDILIQTIADNHPEIPSVIEDEQFWSCRRFLAHFLGETNEGGRVYTLNYDLLLYWVLMRTDMGNNDPINLIINDGFGRDNNTKSEYVKWMGEDADYQRVHYLHGALHLFDDGADLHKFTWVNTRKPLLEQARKAMDDGKFPLFVAEGESDQKLKKIKHSAYLYHSYKSFSKQMEVKTCCLFIFGHSLAENDQHILQKIARGKIPQIYVGLHGDPESQSNQKIKNKACNLRSQREENSPLEVSFFTTESANVWGRDELQC